MADIRIKDLATTATTTASDDFMAVDGATNGTRKLSAATPAFLTSVTTPSLTSPASTNLTLAGGAGNSSIILTPAGTGNVGIGTTTPAYRLSLLANTATTVGTKTTIEIKSSDGLSDPAGQTFIAAEIDSATPGDRGTALTFSTGRQGVGITEKLKIASSGTVSISSTTAGASNAGALVVAGGLATGAASYIGGALTLAGTGLSATNASGSVEFSGSRSSTGGGVTVTYKTGATINWFHGLRGLVDSNWYLFNNATGTNTLIFDYSTNAATFAGAVTATSASAHTFGTTNTVTMTAGDLTLNTGGKKVAFQNSGYENWAIGTRTATTQFVIDSTTTPLGAIFTNNGGLTLAGAVSAASLATAQTAAAATSIVITHKIPITLNGTVYYMALTATP